MMGKRWLAGLLILSMCSVTGVSAYAGEQSVDGKQGSAEESLMLENQNQELSDEVVDETEDIDQPDDQSGVAEDQEDIDVPADTADEEDADDTSTPEIPQQKEESTVEEENVPNVGAAQATGWYQAADGSWRYYNNSADAKGWLTLSNGKYYLDGQGKLVTGWQTIGGNTYYFEQNGQSPNNGLGLMATAWKTVNGSTFYFKDGAMVIGWQDIANQRFYFKKSGGAGTKGAMLTGWQTLGSKGFYFLSNGADGTKGSMVTGWRKIGGKYFYFKTKGKVGVEGSAISGWNKLGGKKYYFKTKGAVGTKYSAITGWNKLSGKYYYFAKSGGLKKTGALKTGWIKDNDKWYYSNSKGIRQTGWVRVSGKWYFLKKSSGVMATGWLYVGGYKYFFNKSGDLDQDVRDKVSGPYYVTVNRKTCVVTVYAKDGKKGYTIPVKAFACSVGLPATPTPTGTFNTQAKYRWHELMGPSYGQYCTRIVGGILFHSVAGSNTTSYNLAAGNYNMLGQPASHGCVRLCVRDAKWIYDNCKLGMTVKISDSVYQPFDKPATIKIPAGQTWDPTDPAVKK